MDRKCQPNFSRKILHSLKNVAVFDINECIVLIFVMYEVNFME